VEKGGGLGVAVDGRAMCACAPWFCKRGMGYAMDHLVARMSSGARNGRWCRVECCLVGSVGGETALHVAAAIPDGGKMSKLIKERCPLAKGMWNSRRNAQGRAPADIAYLSISLPSPSLPPPFPPPNL